MKRTALVTLVFGLTLIVAPAAQAHVMLDDGGSAGAVVLHTDTLGGSGSSPGVTLRADILGGDGYSAAVPMRADVLGGTGEPSAATWLSSELRKDAAAREVPIVSSGDSFAWSEALGAMLLAGMLLTLATAAVTRRRHRLSF